MKDFIKAIRLTLVFCVVLSIGYILVLWGFAQVAGPNGGVADVVVKDGKVVGAANVGQAFTSDRYFHGRPSCAGEGYDATSSSGSNKGVTNPEYLAEVEARIDTLLAHHPGKQRADVPADLVTASASGLDPHISPEAAEFQVARVAAARGMSEREVSALVEAYTELPLMECMGPRKVNVLRLNVALDKAEETAR